MNEILKERRLSSLRSAMEPIIEFLDKDSILEIMLNDDGRVWVDEVGQGMYCTGVTMSPDAAERMIRLIAASMNTEVNERNPSLAAKLPVWGARVQATLPPIVESPTFALRKPPKVVFSLDDYVDKEIMTAEQARFIVDSVKARKNIVIGGGTGSGKTTFANAVLLAIADTKDRVHIIEDNPELQCKAENKNNFLLQPGLYDCHQAIMDQMRYRPDRIIVGEVRDGSALELLKAWNTGHPGGIATIHADNPTAMLDRLCSFLLEALPNAPISYLRQMVSEAVDICVYIEKDLESPAGRRVSGIIEVEGLDNNGNWKVNSLF